MWSSQVHLTYNYVFQQRILILNLCFEWKIVFSDHEICSGGIVIVDYQNLNWATNEVDKTVHLLQGAMIINLHSRRSRSSKLNGHKTLMYCVCVCVPVPREIGQITFKN